MPWREMGAAVSVVAIVFGAGMWAAQRNGDGQQIISAMARIAALETKYREIELNGTTQTKTAELIARQNQDSLARLAGDVQAMRAEQVSTSVQVARLAVQLDERRK